MKICTILYAYSSYPARGKLLFPQHLPSSSNGVPRCNSIMHDVFYTNTFGPISDDLMEKWAAWNLILIVTFKINNKFLVKCRLYGEADNNGERKLSPLEGRGFCRMPPLWLILPSKQCNVCFNYRERLQLVYLNI